MTVSEPNRTALGTRYLWLLHVYGRGALLIAHRSLLIAHAYLPLEAFLLDPPAFD